MKYNTGMSFADFLYANYGASVTAEQSKKANADFLNLLTMKTMKKFVFRINGSTAPDSMVIIFKRIKSAFPEATKEEKKVGDYAWDCYISVYRKNELEAYKMLKGFASQTMHVN